MEENRRQIERHLCSVRKLILDAKYYRNHRATWEEDKSTNCLFLAEVNLKNADRLLDHLKPKEYVNEGRERQDNPPAEKVLGVRNTTEPSLRDLYYAWVSLSK